MSQHINPTPKQTDVASLNSNIATKVKGTNGTGNNSIETRNINNTGVIILNSSALSSGSPSIWLEVNASTNQLYFYKNTGGGWTAIGHIDITP